MKGWRNQSRAAADRHHVSDDPEGLISDRLAMVVAAILIAIGLCVGGHLDLQACVAMGGCK